MDRFLKLVLFSFQLLPLINASGGDSSNIFRGCYHTCHFNNCSSAIRANEFNNRKYQLLNSLYFSCEDECKYECMWHTTDVFIGKGWDVPQFYGKWPFVRFLGCQEPASVLFSILNLVSHIKCIFNFRREVSSNAPLYIFWHFYSLVCINAWIWSAIFHAKDTPTTEKLDYFCAFSMVICSLFTFVVRCSGPKKYKLKIICGVMLLLYFLYHIWYLTSRSFDYGYNMKVNVAVGLLNGFCWLWWSLPRVGRRSYIHWCHVTLALAGASMMFELFDFAPLYWVFDAHSIWHLSTVVLPFYWFRFVKADCLYLLDKKNDLKKGV